MNSDRATTCVYFVQSGIIGLLLTGLVAAQQEKGERECKHTGTPLKSAERAQWKLRESSDATQEVRDILGVGTTADVELDAEVVILEDTNTPYLKSQVVGRPLWKATLRGWKLQLPSAPQSTKDRYNRVFEVWVDPVDGRLVRVKSRWPEGEPPMAPEPSAEIAVAQMLGAGGETYHGFPDAAPRSTFVQALDGLEQGGAAPLAARQIIAEYVLWSDYNIKYRAPRPVWAITLRGEPPLLPPPGSTMEPRFQNRYIVDAETGKFLCATNIPVPEEPEGGERDDPVRDTRP
jgi:hypothetical protein